jgi:uncharacterized membrane protein YraQ (UPF0718 family)
MREFISQVAAGVGGAFAHNWPFLALSVLAAAAAKVYVGTARLGKMLSRHTAWSVVAAVALATLTPFCSCGTMALVLGGLAASAPWAPIVAFLVTSPLTSPSELLLSAGLFGWEFALLFFLGTIVLGLAAGAITAAVERTGWLRGQARPAEADDSPGPASAPRLLPQAAGCGPGTPRCSELPSPRARWRLGELGREILRVGRRLVVYFFLFAAAGYAVIALVPSSQIARFLGGDGIGAVPLAALLGIPAYISTEASLPLVAGLTAGGMSLGAAMAFLVTAAGTSLGAISGLLVIARRRVVGLVIALLFAGALALGWSASALL